MAHLRAKLFEAVSVVGASVSHPPFVCVGAHVHLHAGAAL